MSNLKSESKPEGALLIYLTWQRTGFLNVVLFIGNRDKQASLFL